jgi:hypothetical protein
MPTPPNTKNASQLWKERPAADMPEDRDDVAINPEQLEDDLKEHHSKSSAISGGDVDAAWNDADQAGDEAIGGTVATPDQDVVEEIGKAVGITYNDDEPLDTEEKLRRRDANRWELNPASAEEQDNKESITWDEFEDNFDLEDEAEDES